MTGVFRTLDPAGLKSALHDGGEIALLDAREEVTFEARHLLMAACVPLSRLELLVDACVPRRSTRVVWCDAGEGLAQRAAARMVSLGYTDVAVLAGPNVRSAAPVLDPSLRPLTPGPVRRRRLRSERPRSRGTCGRSAGRR